MAAIPYLLMFVTSITSLAEGILIKKYNQKHSKGGFIFTAFVSLFAMVFFFISDLITDPNGLQFNIEVLPYALIAGVLYCAASLATYLALQCGSFAITMLILSYSLVISILYGLIFLHDSVNIFTYIGFAVITVSIFLVRGKQPDGAGKKKKFSVKWLIYMIISVLGSGFLSVVSKYQQDKFNDVYNNEFMIICLAFSALTLFIVGFIKDGRDCVYILKKGTPYAALAGLANGATNLLGIVINSSIFVIPYAVKIATRSSIKTVVSFLVSYLLFKEKFEKRQLIGVALGAIAVILLNLKI